MRSESNYVGWVEYEIIEIIACGLAEGASPQLFYSLCNHQHFVQVKVMLKVILMTNFSVCGIFVHLGGRGGVCVRTNS